MLDNSNKLIGLSLSRCVLDILIRKVEVDNVVKIYTACCWETEQELEELLERYHKFHWNQFDFTIVKKLVTQLLPKIHKTRLLEPPRVADASKTHWVLSEADISWHTYNKKTN